MKHLSLLSFFFIFSISLCAQPFKVLSPDGSLTLTANTDKNISWSVTYNGHTTIPNVNINLETNQGKLFDETTTVVNHTIQQHKKTLRVTVPVKSAEIEDYYNELTLYLSNGNHLVFRVYDDGLAYRFSTDFKDDVEIKNEILSIEFPAQTHCWFSAESSFLSHFEQLFTYQRLDTIPSGQFHALPLLASTPEKVRIWISEADQHDYPALFLATNGNYQLNAIFPKYILQSEANPKHSPDRNEIILKEADYIAKTNGKRSLPWRIYTITNDDRKLVSNQLVYQLSSPQAIDETDWIKPGKVAWDWYNANNLRKVDFKSGLNTPTYKYYIDFASKYNLEYIILDEGWSQSTTEILTSNPDINLHEIIDYGKSKGVGVILWVLWKPLLSNLEEILNTYATWGVAGIKVDFMQRADQQMVNIFEEIAKVAAKNRLIVDFHGCFKPNGLQRTYPNVLTFEGVKGNENHKWSAQITPEHNLTLPFTRMVAGPMDYTPGAMRNANRKNFAPSFERPMSLGTRCHQLAMYIIYESPLQMLCDSPSEYLNEPEIPAFLSKIPTIWDQTIILDASVSEFILSARRSGNNWYIAAMTNHFSRDLDIVLDFLPDGEYNMEIMSDGINADRHAEDYRYEVKKVNNNTKMKIHLAAGGGFAAILTKE